MDVREEAKVGLEKAIRFVEEGIMQILQDELDEEHGVSVCPGATAMASLSLLILGKGFERSQRGGVNWLIKAQQNQGWGKIPGGTPDPEVTQIGRVVLQGSRGSLLSKLTLMEEAKQLAQLVLTLGQDVVPGLEGPSAEEIGLPHILEDSVLEKLPPYGRSVVVAAALLAANEGQKGIEEGLKMIQESQMPDGSWAEDIVATSLCIMALFRFRGMEMNIHHAGIWLTRKQYASGGWPAFDQLKTWAVGWSLSILDERSFLSEGILNKARVWLAQAGNSDGSFGTTPPSSHPDLDDTAIALRGLPVGCETSNRTIRLLRRLQNEDGSWGTFPSFSGQPPNIESRRPVYISSLDVTVHVVEALLRQGLQPAEPSVQKALRWILLQQKKDGPFQSVWFENAIYGSAQVIDLLNNVKFGWGMLRMSRQAYYARQRGVEFLLHQCNSNGDWGDSVAETSLAISALKNEGAYLDRNLFDRAIQSILSRQKQTGSFIPIYQGIYAKGWNYEEPISTALSAIRALEWYVNQAKR